MVSNVLDKVYQLPGVHPKKETVNLCLNKLLLSDFSHIIEPSGVYFTRQTPAKEQAKIVTPPTEHDDISWLGSVYSFGETDNVLAFGMPMFGHQNNLAMKFVNHSALFSHTIAFILPASFKKQSVQSKVNKFFHLTSEDYLPMKAFVKDGQPHHVPAVFQIWTKQSYAREKTPVLVSNRIKFVKKSQHPDFSVQRIGANAGKASIRWKDKSEASNYFVKIVDGSSVFRMVDLFNDTVFVEREWSSGPESLTKQEIIANIG